MNVTMVIKSRIEDEFIYPKNDNNSEPITVVVPRYPEESTDLSQFSWQVVARNAKNQMVWVDVSKVETTDTRVLISWMPTTAVTCYAGKVKYNLVGTSDSNGNQIVKQYTNGRITIDETIAPIEKTNTGN